MEWRVSDLNINKNTMTHIKTNHHPPFLQSSASRYTKKGSYNEQYLLSFAHFCDLDAGGRADDSNALYLGLLLQRKGEGQM